VVEVECSVAVVGATGAVGQEMLQVLAERRFPVRELRAFASARSAGRELRFGGEPVVVRELDAGGFAGVDLALFSAGAERSRAFAPAAVRAGAVVVDNSSAFRMDPAVPLVVPEVNGDAALAHRGIVANPNCSTIQMVVALEPVRALFGLRRITVATYQSVSGTGARAMRELAELARAHLEGAAEAPAVYPHPIAFNCLPQVDVFDRDGHTREEIKMRDETRKIFSDPSIAVFATCVRVPVFRGHCEAVVVETERPVDLVRLRAALAAAPGTVLCDAPGAYPLPRAVAERDEVFVGRLRLHAEDPRVLSMWVVADNLRKGAATNAVQIAERLLAADRLRQEVRAWPSPP
jgi:aspartate-semialdehyde dehydrogenase